MKLIASPIIDRAFRFVEMVGVTALLAFIVRPFGAAPQATVIMIGSALALIYLFEPAMSRLIKFAHFDDRAVRIAMRLVLVASFAFILLSLMTFVGFVATVLSPRVFPIEG